MPSPAAEPAGPQRRRRIAATIAQTVARIATSTSGGVPRSRNVNAIEFVSAQGPSEHVVGTVASTVHQPPAQRTATTQSTSATNDEVLSRAGSARRTRAPMVSQDASVLIPAS